MRIDLKEWGLSLSPEVLEKFPVLKNTNTVTSAFNDGSVDYSPMIVADGLAKIDPDLSTLQAYSCRVASDNDNVAEIIDDQFVGSAYCGSGRENKDLTQVKACEKLLEIWH